MFDFAGLVNIFRKTIKMWLGAKWRLNNVACAGLSQSRNVNKLITLAMALALAYAKRMLSFHSVTITN